ncbi:MAG: hypothetical protein ACM3QW_09200 [Ignavibacteriales bacterium]
MGRSRFFDEDSRIGGIDECFERGSFFRLLVSLLNFRVRVLTEGDKQFVRGILTDVNRSFITLSGREIYYIPIREITIVTRDDRFCDDDRDRREEAAGV